MKNRSFSDYVLVGKLIFLERMIKFRHKLGLHPEGQAHGLDGPLIVSLTSYPKRFAKLHLTLYCLLNQKIKADEILLWITDEDLKDLPQEILQLEDKGVTIKTTTDTRSYKKIIPTIKEYPGSYIVTVDDDMYYPADTLESLIGFAKQNPGYVIANRTHLIELDECKQPKPYRQWLHLQSNNKRPRLNFMTGVGGVLYPPNVFSSEVFDESLFMELAPHGDDIWLYWMVRRKGNYVLNSGFTVELYNWRGTQQCALLNQNVLNDNGNDLQISRMLEYFGFPD